MNIREDNKKRCHFVNLDNPIYVKYHDDEWCIEKHNDKELYELLILESFQAGLSWECILNKRKNFKKAYDNFDIEKVIEYDNKKIADLMNDKGIIRNRRKITASINNSKIFKEIQNEYGSFDNYIWHFTDNKIVYEKYETIKNDLSDLISKDLYKRGMRFVGTLIIYSYLQAIGIISSHSKNCFKGSIR